MDFWPPNRDIIKRRNFYIATPKEMFNRLQILLRFLNWTSFLIAYQKQTSSSELRSTDQPNRSRNILLASQVKHLKLQEATTKSQEKASVKETN